MVDVDHAPTITFTSEAYSPPVPPISVPVSELIPVPKELNSVSGQRLESPPTVSNHAVLTIVVANYWSFSTCLWPPVVPLCKMA